MIDDEKVWKDVICLREFNDDISYDGDMVNVGAGVRLQRLILEVNERGLGGIEYLFSVPGTVGGAIYMNAGRGKMHDKSISDYLVSVRVLINGEVKEFDKEECQFAYRKSLFQKMDDAIILSGTFSFPQMAKSISSKMREERIKLAEKNQDNRYANAGTTFSEANAIIMKLFMVTAKNKKIGCCFSDKTLNWLQNRGQGTYKEALTLISKVKVVHKIFHQKCRVEICIW